MSNVQIEDQAGNKTRGRAYVYSYKAEGTKNEKEKNKTLKKEA